MTIEDNLLFKSKPIGIIHSSLKEVKGSPIQPVFAQNSEGIVEVYEPYRQALKDLDGFERIWLIYWFHQAVKFRPIVKPFLDTVERGLFATRAPCRPNPIGMSPVRLLRVDDGMLYIAEVDILDGTPLLDIKPYISKFDKFDVTRNGWQDNVTDKSPTADKRFHKENECNE
jgi:tRNA-Thr(GGU) m(6)t(6)A37 methyltransferase TsaA